QPGQRDVVAAEAARREHRREDRAAPESGAEDLEELKAAAGGLRAAHLPEHFRLLHVAADPEREEGRKQSEEEEIAPGDFRRRYAEHDREQEHGEPVADGPSALDAPDGAAADPLV